MCLRCNKYLASFWVQTLLNKVPILYFQLSKCMNIQWVLADNLILDPTADIMRMKRGGAFWGSWKKMTI